MGRREERSALQSSWIVIEPRKAGAPIRKKDIEDEREVAEQEAEMQTDMTRLREEEFRCSEIPRQLIAHGAWRDQHQAKQGVK